MEFVTQRIPGSVSTGDVVILPEDEGMPFGRYNVLIITDNDDGSFDVTFMGTDNTPTAGFITTWTFEPPVTG